MRLGCREAAGSFDEITFDREWHGCGNLRLNRADEAARLGGVDAA